MASIGDSTYPGGIGDNIANFGSLRRTQAPEDGTITAIENYIGVHASPVLYRPVIYRGTSSIPTTLAYYGGSNLSVAATGVDSHTLSSSISMTSGEWLWHGIRAISGGGLAYGAATGVDGADVSPMNDPPPDPCSGYSVFNDTRYASALIYTPSAGDTTPDSFTFTDITNASLSTQYTSNTITVSGITAAAAISISGGSGTYNINGGSYTASSGTVNNGDTVTARVTSSGSNSTAVSTTVTIGGVSDTYTVTTLAAGATIDSYPATVRSGATGVAYTTTGLSAVSGITIGSLAATSISDTSGDGTHSVPSLTDGVAHELYGTKTVTITGTGGSPTTSTSFQPLSTQSFVTLSGILNTTETGVLFGFSPAAAVGDQIVWTTANGAVDAQGNYTGDFTGTQTMWHIDATDNVARSYDVITGTASAVLKYWNGSAWVVKPLKYWNGSAWVAKTLKYWNGSSWI